MYGFRSQNLYVSERSPPTKSGLRGLLFVFVAVLADVDGVAAALTQHEGCKSQCEDDAGENADLHDRAGEGRALLQERRGFNREHHDLFDACQDADDEERL